MSEKLSKFHEWRIASNCSDDPILARCIRKGDDLILDLSDASNRQFLLREFRKLHTMEDAKRWRVNVGILYPSINSPKDILKISRTVQWVFKFFRELQKENFRFLKRSLFVTSVLQRRASKFREEEFYLIEERVLTALESKQQVVSDDLINYLSVWLAAKEPKRVLVTFAPPPEFGIGPRLPYISGSATGVGLDSPHVFELPETLIEQEFTTVNVLNDQRVLKSLAYSYLQKVLTQLSANLQVTIRLHEAPDGYSYIDQGFSLNSPWEAIVSELIKLITCSMPDRRCTNPRCGAVFSPTRSHQRFCKRPGCRKAASRQNKASTQSAALDTL